MTERPILFSAPMVRAILDGRKSQTRRVVKRIPWRAGANPWFSQARPFVNAGEWRIAGSEEMTAGFRCPYGRPGDRLWVRETFSGFIAYERHGYPLREWGNKVWYWADGNPPRGDWTRPRPSIHMPRALSRITLEVTGVRMERLQAISEEDAVAEGASYHDGAGVGHSGWRHDFGDVHSDARSSFARLWNDINGAGSWSANPWVWVVSFKGVAP